MKISTTLKLCRCFQIKRSFSVDLDILQRSKDIFQCQTLHSISLPLGIKQSGNYAQRSSPSDKRATSYHDSNIYCTSFLSLETSLLSLYFQRRHVTMVKSPFPLPWKLSSSELEKYLNGTPSGEDQMRLCKLQNYYGW